MRAVVFALVVGLIQAFVPVPVTTTSTPALTRVNAYVPDGLTAAQWAVKQKEEAAKKAAAKAKIKAKGGSVPLNAWLKELEKKQQLKGEKIVGSGHTYAKQKFSTKEQYDATKGKK